MAAGKRAKKHLGGYVRMQGANVSLLFAHLGNTDGLDGEMQSMIAVNGRGAMVEKLGAAYTTLAASLKAQHGLVMPEVDESIVEQYVAFSEKHRPIKYLRSRRKTIDALADKLDELADERGGRLLSVRQMWPRMWDVYGQMPVAQIDCQGWTLMAWEMAIAAAWMCVSVEFAQTGAILATGSSARYGSSMNQSRGSWISDATKAWMAGEAT